MKEPVTIRIELDEVSREYAPGEAVRGSVHLRAEAPWHVRYCRIGLLMVVESRVMKKEIVEEVDLLAPGSEAPVSCTRPFSIYCPMMPWSYDGKLLKLNWRLAVAVQGKTAREQQAFRDVVIRPGA